MQHCELHIEGFNQQAIGRPLLSYQEITPRVETLLFLGKPGDKRQDLLGLSADDLHNLRLSDSKTCRGNGEEETMFHLLVAPKIAPS